MTKEEFLLDGLEYYTVDPVNRRCVDEQGQCKYSPKSLNLTASEGCMIGRKLSPELAEKLDNQQMVDITSIITSELFESELPDYMTMKNVSFLAACQQLHDNNLNWEEKGLSEYGKRTIIRIIEEHSLDKQAFDEFLIGSKWY